jgi:hypothetical protein
VVAGCSLLLLSQAPAQAATVSGDSTTIVRVQESAQDKDLVPLYEYLHLSVADSGKDGDMSLQLGGWGRVDLGDRSSVEGRNNGDLQYGYLNYYSKKNNFQASVGRQFIAEGVATEKVDGVYLRTDLAAGFTAAAFVGAPAVTESKYEGGDLIYGARLAHTNPKYYSLGLSALRSEDGGTGLREEEGVDLWLRPMPQLDITGRSSYNSITSGWMEHAYAASYTPTEKLRLSASVSQVNYLDYFHNVTTTALSLTNGILNPNEDVLTLGGSVGYAVTKDIDVVIDYKNFDYSVAGDAEYLGGKLAFVLPGSVLAGASYHRMSGESDRLKYDEYRAYVSKKLGKADVTLDVVDINFDQSINGTRNTYVIAAAAGYDVASNFRVAADVDYSRTADFDYQVRGLVKATYQFDLAKEGK